MRPPSVSHQRRVILMRALKRNEGISLAQQHKLTGLRLDSQVLRRRPLAGVTISCAVNESTHT